MWPLIIMFTSFLLIALVLFISIRRQLIEIEAKFGPVTPLWKHVLTELSAIMTHPHPWAEELDILLEEANQEPQVQMDPARFERLITLLAERAASTNPEMRGNERDAATMYLIALRFAREEALSKVDLSGIKLVGTQAPTEQTIGDAELREKK